MAKDGAFNISLTGEGMWQRFCRAIGEEEWIQDPRFADNKNRFHHGTELTAMINGRLAGKTREEWIAFFREAEVPCGPIHSLAETFEDPQVKAREMVRVMNHPEAGEIKVIANPVRLSRTPARHDQPPPTLGEHTAGILAELGYSPEETARLSEEKVVVCDAPHS